MSSVVETTCVATIFGFAMLLAFDQARGAEISYPEKCTQSTMAMPGHNTGDAAKLPEMSSEMTEYQKSFGLGMRDMNTNMMAGMMQDDADVAFVCGMIAHHMGAISMAETELANGDNAMAKDMARRIIEAQTVEIDAMRAWLEKGEK